MSGLAEINSVLEKEAPILFRALSPLGREVFFPPDIPFQAQEAKGTTFNGTIGVFTDGEGNALPLESMSEVLDLDTADLDTALSRHQNSACPGARGNGIASRILLSPQMYTTSRSKPRPKPACGTVP